MKYSRSLKELTNYRVSIIRNYDMEKFLIIEHGLIRDLPVVTTRSGETDCIITESPLPL
ncbi:MAG TPA: hypothetical protein VH415_09300 [Nitrososphaeraceae archaeon]|jgi:hypothetical protein